MRTKSTSVISRRDSSRLWFGGMYRADVLASALGPSVNMRKHVFASQPLWESAKLQGTRQKTAKSYSADASERDASLVTLKDDAPGLALLWEPSIRGNAAGYG